MHHRQGPAARSGTDFSDHRSLVRPEPDPDGLADHESVGQGAGLGGVVGFEDPFGKGLAFGERVPGQGLADCGEAAGGHGELTDAEADEDRGEQGVGGGLTADAYGFAVDAARSGAAGDEFEERGLPGVEQVGEVS